MKNTNRPIAIPDDTRSTLSNIANVLNLLECLDHTLLRQVSGADYGLFLIHGELAAILNDLAHGDDDEDDEGAEVGG